MTETAEQNPYWVYKIPNARRARLHHAECGHCDHGQGVFKVPQYSGSWNSFADLASAKAYMESLEYKNSKTCGNCQRFRPEMREAEGETP